MEFYEPGLDFSLVLMEGEDGQHVTSSIELEYLIRLSKGSFMLNLAVSVGSDLNGLTTLKALKVVHALLEE